MTAAAACGLHDPPPAAPRPLERARGTWGMGLFIATEAMLFALLFFAYFYLGGSQARWPPKEDPSYTYALVLLAILLGSGAAAHWAQRGIERGLAGRLRAGLVVALVLSFAFLFVQSLEYAKHLRSLTPAESAYGSIFYTITSFHLAHVILGVLMLLFVLARAMAGHFDAGRHQAVKNAVAYWHFVDVVWILIVAILYLSPHFYGSGRP